MTMTDVDPIFRPRASVRMYRHGLGDCHLVKLRRGDGPPFRILIDCGVILGTPDAKARINAVVADIARDTGGEIDLLVVTHAHGDHVSGFLQAEAGFRALRIAAVWMAWTEDPADAFAQSLVRVRRDAFNALQRAERAMHARGDEAPAAEVAALLDFFEVGAAGRTTEDAVEVARSLAPPGALRYCRPGQPPHRPPGVEARLFVLGPPRDARLIRRSSPTRGSGQTYEMSPLGLALAALGPLAGAAASGRPFSSLQTIPTEVARIMPFFREHYWTGAGTGDGWRTIDGLYCQAARDLALKLDNDTNNTSLVLAIELDGQSGNGAPGSDVLLFAADAQVGNQESWKDVNWSLPDSEGGTFSALDLVRRTLLYKVGHHGSHNATLRPHLESMERLRYALNPVDEAMARKKRWAHIPLQSLEAALESQSDHGLIRADRPPPAGRNVVEDPLFFEVHL